MSIILKTFKAKQVMEGAGVLVNRVFGYYETKDFDPFLMLDYFETKGQSESPGFPWHPHKGIETITYFVRGSGAHEDSMGNKGIIGPGELQWMTAGKGIYHKEMPGSSPDGYQGFQFWVNLPQKEKLVAPSYKYIKKGEMKSYHTDGVEVKVIAGTYHDIVGPIDKSNLGISMFHVVLEKGKTIELTRQVNKEGYVFVFEGKGTIDKDNIEMVTAYTLGEGTFKITSKNKMQFIYAEGAPLNEPIVWKGPIVMNTREEIEQTFQDLNNGTFLKDE